MRKYVPHSIPVISNATTKQQIIVGSVIFYLNPIENFLFNNY